MSRLSRTQGRDFRVLSAVRNDDFCVTVVEGRNLKRTM